MTKVILQFLLYLSSQKPSMNSILFKPEILYLDFHAKNFMRHSRLLLLKFLGLPAWGQSGFACPAKDVEHRN